MLPTRLKLVALLLFASVIIGLETGAGYPIRAEGGTMAKSKYPQVLLENAVKEFKRVTGNLQGHLTVGEQVYQQPHVYLPTHLVQMRVAGWKETDFDTIAAVSGASALFAYQPKTFMPKYAHLLIGMDQRIADATGFGFEWVRFQGAEQAWGVLKQSLDSGRPLKGWHYENVIFAGYQEAANQEDRQVFAMADGPETYAKWWTWQEFSDWVKGWSQSELGRHAKRVRKVAAKQVALRVMTDLVAWSQQPPEAVLRRFPQAKFGLAGMEAFAKDVADTSKDVKYFDAFASCHALNPQWTLRNSTAVYLKRLAERKTFPKQANDHLIAAAKEYRAAYQAWNEMVVDHLPPNWAKEAGWKTSAPKDAWSLEANRRAGADCIRQAIEHEKAALAEIEEALAMLTVKRGDGRVRIEGVPNIKMTEGWPRIRGMEILLKHRGEKASLDEIMVYSGDAFNLCHASQWELRGGLSIPTEPLANVAEAYGYSSRWTAPSWFHELRALEMPERWRKSEEFLEQLWEQIDAGYPVLIGGAYGECGAWRVIVGYDRDNKQLCYVGGKKAYEWTDLIDPKVKELGFWDSQVRGAIRPNFFGGWQCNAAFLMGEKTSNPTEETKVLTGLGRAVEMFHAPEFKTNLYGGVTYYFGEKAYQEWANDLEELDYPADLKKPRPKLPERYDMSNFGGQVSNIVQGRARAAKFCEKAAKVMPQAKPQLLAAAKAYREEVAIAKKAFPAFLTGTDKQREAWLSKEASREKGVEAIREMLAQERAAIAQIEKALAAITPSKVKREGGKVSIEGVKNFTNDHSGLSHLRAIACVLEFHGESVDFDRLMGISGEAFCYYYHPDGTFLSEFVHSWDIANAALGPYGYEGVWRSEPTHDVTPALEAIQSEIEQGRLVIAPGIMPADDGIHSLCGRWFVVSRIDLPSKRVQVLGSENGPVEVSLPKGDDPRPEPHPRWYGICRTFEGMDGHYGPKYADNPILLVKEVGPPKGEKEVVLTSLKRAVDLAREQSTTSRYGWGAGVYLGGYTALQRLHDDLLAAQGNSVEEFEKLNPVKGDPFRGLFDELGHLKLLSDRRRSAARFMELAARHLPESARSHLAAAAQNFERSSAEALKAFEIRYGSAKELDRMEKFILAGTHGDDNPEWVAYWKRADEALATRKQREAMAAHLTEVLRHEKAAIAEIEKVLAAEGIEVAPPQKAATAQADYSKLKLTGNGHTQDSFSLTIQAAAKLLGKDADYEMVYALSSNAFTPAIDKGEDCTAWWHVQGWLGGKKIETVAGRLGLQVERLDLPPDNLSPQDPEEVFQRKSLEHRKACAPILRQAMERGAILLVDGGWRMRTDHAFLPWCWWGIITQAEEDGTILGASLNGQHDNPLHYVGGCWAVSPAKRTLTPHQADLNMLRNAVARIRGDAEPFLPTELAVYGLAAMDTWIAKMRQTPFCPPCFEHAPDRVWTCAINNAQTTTAGAQAAASYLRKRKDTFAQAARPHLEAAAKHYDNIAQLLKPALTGEGGEHYREFIGDLKKQKAHAQVLEQVKAELSAAADEMEKALACLKGD